LNIIWAPWRMAFIERRKKKDPRYAEKRGCIFCAKPAENDDELNFIYSRREKAFGMLNSFPYNSGHLMIAPFRHVTALEDLSGDEWRDLIRLLQDSLGALRGSMRPEGFNVGFNIGKASGAGFEHVHLHIVPRWAGDTNFMPAIADTKVIPEGLRETYRKIKAGITAGSGP